MLAIRESQSKAGMTPLEIMLKNMRRVDAMADAAEQAAVTFVREAVEKMSPEDLLVAMLAEAKKVIGLRNFAQDCARDAAPYMHPRLAAVAVSEDKKSPLFKRIERLIIDPTHDSASDTDGSRVSPAT